MNSYDQPSLAEVRERYAAMEAGDLRHLIDSGNLSKDLSDLAKEILQEKIALEQRSAPSQETGKGLVKYLTNGVMLVIVLVVVRAIVIALTKKYGAN